MVNWQISHVGLEKISLLRSRSARRLGREAQLAAHRFEEQRTARGAMTELNTLEDYNQCLELRFEALFFSDDFL